MAIKGRALRVALLATALGMVGCDARPLEHSNSDAWRIAALERYTLQLEQQLVSIKIEVRQWERWQAWQLIKKESAKRRVEAEG